MQSKASDVDSYLEGVPADRRACLDQLRQLCRRTLKGYQETTEYGMPCYNKDGVVAVAFASQKNYITLYILKQDVVDAHRDRLKGLKVGKSCIQFTRPEQIDFAVIKSLLTATVKSKSQAC